ncbi:hypothetical protein KC336_g17481 [Hortaea werneckii]|nr:hypothetical protein KC336_g17481 [Hortaea werneckii]
MLDEYELVQLNEGCKMRYYEENDRPLPVGPRRRLMPGEVGIQMTPEEIRASRAAERRDARGLSFDQQELDRSMPSPAAFGIPRSYGSTSSSWGYPRESGYTQRAHYAPPPQTIPRDYYEAPLDPIESRYTQDPYYTPRRHPGPRDYRERSPDPVFRPHNDYYRERQPLRQIQPRALPDPHYQSRQTRYEEYYGEPEYFPARTPRIQHRPRVGRDEEFYNYPQYGETEEPFPARPHDFRHGYGDTYDMSREPRRPTSNFSARLSEQMMHGALPQTTPRTPALGGARSTRPAHPDEPESVQYDPTRFRLVPLSPKKPRHDDGHTKSPTPVPRPQGSDPPADDSVFPDLDVAIPDKGKTPFFCPICRKSDVQHFQSIANHFKEYHGTLPNGNAFLSMFGGNTKQLIPRLILLSEFRELESLYTREGFAAVVQWFKTHPRVPEDHRATETKRIEDIEQKYGSLFDDSHWRDTKLIPWAVKTLLPFYKGLREWRTNRGTPARLKSSETDGHPRLTNCMPYRGCQPQKDRYPAELSTTSVSFENEGRRTTTNRLVWIKLAACRLDRDSFIAIGKREVEMSHTCNFTDCMNMDHGNTEPSALNHNRRSCMAAADEDGNDFCTRHALDGPCRKYTSDKTVGFWLGIPRKGQPDANGSGRYRCGHSGCRSTRAEQLDIRLHYMQDHLPQLSAGNPLGNEESGTEDNGGSNDED